MFQRAIGLVRAVEGLIEPLNDFAYVQCDDVGIKRLIDGKVEQLYGLLQTNKTSKVLLSFSERRARNTWWSQSEERICFEQWLFQVRVLNPEEVGDLQAYKDELEAQLKAHVVRILKFVGEKQSHIPPLKTNELVPFPCEISFPSASETRTAESLLDMLRTPGPLLT